jgi:8-oxo-dGTP pyrophosphatase MutT (NUDIX family)
MSAPSHGPARWRRGTERLIASTRVLDLKGVRFSNPGRGTDGEFIVVSAPDWVNVLALTPDRRLVLVRQFRCGTDDFSLEIPGGVINAGEDPVAAGVRELREETGYEGSGARLLGSVHPNPAIQDNRCHIVLVEGAVRRAAAEWDADEEIEVTTAPLAEVLAWARSGRITHSLVHCALFQLEGLVP